MRPSTQSFVKILPIYPLLDRCRDWYTLRKGKRNSTFSQHREDRTVVDYFNNQPGLYVDVGANHPFRISNTYLLYLNGWRGLTIEPMPEVSRKHRRYRPRDLHFNVGAGAENGVMKLYDLVPGVLTTFDEEVAHAYIRTGRAVLSSNREIPIRTISSICKEVQVEEHIDFLNVDCEGYDLNVLKGVDWSRNRPTLVCVETRGHVATSEGHKNAGNDIHELLSDVGYRILREQGCNTFYEVVSR